MKNLKIMFLILKYSLMSAMEYKISFITQIIFMLINNFVVISVFYLFFLKFETIWWLVFFEWAMLFWIFLFLFSYLFIFVGWFFVISNHIREWKMDNFLLLPTHPLFTILPSRFKVSAIWDFITSVWVFYLVYILSNLSVFSVILLCFKTMFFAIFWTFVVLWFLIFFHSLAFYFGSSDQLSTWAFEAILWPSMYPPAIYDQTLLKPILMSILPVFFTTFLPFSLVLNFSLWWFISLILASIFFMSLWIFTFNKWLKKYESGNMMNTNV